MSANPFDQLLKLAKPPAEPARFLWGAVTATSPLTVLADGSDTPWVNPDNIAAGLAVGNRVFIVLQGRRATVLGKAQ